MFGLFKKTVYPIGVDISGNQVMLVQLAQSDQGLELIAAGIEEKPVSIEPNTSQWQRWAIEAITKIYHENDFKGKDVIACLGPADTMINYLKAGKKANENLDAYIRSKLSAKITCGIDSAIIRHIPSENDNLIVIATEREKVNRHLAIYEKAGLKIKSLNIWPDAVTNAYTSFFARRQSDLKSVVLLVNIRSHTTEVVINRHKNLLLAESFRIGAQNIKSSQELEKFKQKLSGCVHRFTTMYRDNAIDRLLFVSGHCLAKEIYTEVAKELGIMAQMGDCLDAIKIKNSEKVHIDRRESQLSWATALGLSLS
jgi:Tfp pilus assembly PilM family ATPase